MLVPAIWGTTVGCGALLGKPSWPMATQALSTYGIGEVWVCALNSISIQGERMGQRSAHEPVQILLV